MNSILSNNRMLVGSIVLLCIALTGCGVKKDAASQAASQAPPRAAQTVEEHAKEKARVFQTIQSMTPEQRAAYFKAHPEDVQALTQ